MVNQNERRQGVAFWKKSTGNYCSHYLGLSKQDKDFFIAELQKPNPRLILFAQSDSGANSPDFVLKFFKQEGENTGPMPGPESDAI